jgi:hypothetical protein
VCESLLSADDLNAPRGVPLELHSPEGQLGPANELGDNHRPDWEFMCVGVPLPFCRCGLGTRARRQDRWGVRDFGRLKLISNAGQAIDPRLVGVHGFQSLRWKPASPLTHHPTMRLRTQAWLDGSPGGSLRSFGVQQGPTPLSFRVCSFKSSCRGVEACFRLDVLRSPAMGSDTDESEF